MMMKYGLLAAVLMFQSAAAPLTDLGGFLNLGLAGVILWIWWNERKDRLSQQQQDDAKYERLLQRLVEAIETRIVVCPFDNQKAAVAMNAKQKS